MPDDSIERVAPPVVEPLEGHLGNIICCQHCAGRRAVNCHQRALEEYDNFLACLKDLLQQGSDNPVTSMS